MRGRVARRDRENPARKRRLRLRPAVPDSGIRQDECRARARPQKPYQPPRAGARRACGAAAAAASSAAQGGIAQIMAAVRGCVALSTDAEITLEANTGTFEVEKFHAFRKAGINRLSIGIQSFNSRHLKVLGRIHDGNEARAAIEIAREY